MGFGRAPAFLYDAPAGVFFHLACWNRLQFPARNDAIDHPIFQGRFGLQNIIAIDVAGNLVHLLACRVGQYLV